MKKLFLIICLVLSGSVFSQAVSEEDIVGVYNIKSNDPMGGSTMVFMPDDTYVISYFGGIQKGTWELNGQNVFLSVSTEPQFVLYGRTLSSLDNKTQVNFQMDPYNGTLVGLDSNKKTSLKSVFNQNGNCFKYPFIFTQEKELIQLHAAQVSSKIADSDSQGMPYAKVYHFNIFGAYNDLVLINLSPEYTTESKAQVIYKDGKLYMGPDDKGLTKRPLESLSDEDSAFIKQFSNKSLFSNKLQHGDEFFPYTENPSREEFKPYNRIDVLEASRQGVDVQDGSFFTATCN